MSSTIENGLQRQAALPHFFPHFFPNLTALIQIFNYRIILAFFKNSEFAAFFDENLPNLTALEQTTHFPD